LESFGFEFFVDDLITGVDIRFSGWCHRALGPNRKGQFFVSFL